MSQSSTSSSGQRPIVPAFGRTVEALREREGLEVGELLRALGEAGCRLTHEGYMNVVLSQEPRGASARQVVYAFSDYFGLDERGRETLAGLLFYDILRQRLGDLADEAYTPTTKGLPVEVAMEPIPTPGDISE